MGHLSSNPVEDAQMHFREMDSKQQEADYKCDACGDGFGKGYGVKVTDEKFCSECVSKGKHFEHYRKEAGLNDRQIWDLTYFTEKL